MAEVILDECLSALLEAQGYLKDYTEISAYQEIFEAEDIKNAETIAKNQEVESKSTNAFSKALSAVRKIISTLVNAIGDFLRKVTMGKGEYEAFQNFKELAKKDPSLANKKVTVKDFRKIKNEYNSLIAEIDAKTREVKANENTPIEDLTKKVTNFMASVGKSAGTIITCDVAMNLAKGNIETARSISSALKSQDALMAQLEKELGAKGAKKYVKKMDSLGKVISLQRLKTMLFKQEYETATDAVNATVNTLKGYVEGKPGAFVKNGFMASSLLKNDNTGAVIKGVGKTVANASAGAAKEKTKQVFGKNKAEKKKDKEGINASSVEYFAKGFMKGKKK